MTLSGSGRSCENAGGWNSPRIGPIALGGSCRKKATGRMKAFFHVIDIDEALRRIRCFSPLAGERINLSRALNRVLCDPVASPEDLPPFSRSTMDGFAVTAAATFGASESNPTLMTVAGEVVMGAAPDFEIRHGQVARISTGGMLPKGADAVVMVEHTAALDETYIEVYKSVAPGMNVILAGEDFKRGGELVAGGVRLRAQEIGVLAAMGISHVLAHRVPRVAIVSTGDEIVAAHESPCPGKLRDVNSHTLAGQCTAIGAQPVSRGVVPDRFDLLKDALLASLKDSDTVLISGGSSVGVRDLSLQAISSMPDARILAHGISISPGKPTILADCGGKPVIGLPGHVASAMVVFAVVVVPVIRRLSGESENRDRFPAIPARVSRNVASAQGRDDFVRVRLAMTEAGYLAEPILGKSGLLHTMVRADGLVRIPKHLEGIEKGDAVWVIPLV